MNALLNELPASDFTIVGFPCNQFGHQEPGANSTEILNGLQHVRPGQGFEPHPRLHMMMKTDVNGKNQHPLYAYLKTACLQPTTAKFDPKENFWSPIHFNDITWNFEKFLISPQGVPLYRFRPMIEPFDLKKIINILRARKEILASQESELNSVLDALDKSIQARLRE